MVRMLDKEYHAAVTPTFVAPRKASFMTSPMFKHLRPVVALRRSLDAGCQPDDPSYVDGPRGVRMVYSHCPRPV